MATQVHLGQMTNSLATRSPVRALWLVQPDLRYLWDHGGHLRTYALAREWIARGIHVHFAGLGTIDSTAGRRIEYLEELRSQGVLSTFTDHPVSRSAPAARLASATRIPALQSAALRRSRVSAMDEVIRLASASDVTVVADAPWLFAVPALRNVSATIIEWRDSYSMFWRRQYAAARSQGRWVSLLEAAREIAFSSLVESYYGSAAHANVVVSDVDGEALRSRVRDPETVYVIPNGVSVPARGPEPSGARRPCRITFSGNMDWPPNHFAAIWFIDSVLPLVRRACPDAEFMVVGRNPLPDLLARQAPGVVIRGAVPDVGAELATSSVYVAPMKSGSGFKNKVVEAMAAGVMVVGTDLALEFLPQDVRALLVCANDPRAMADAISDCLLSPDDYRQNVLQFGAALEKHFKWSAKAGELLSVADAAASRFRGARAPA